MDHGLASFFARRQLVWAFLAVLCSVGLSACSPSTPSEADAKRHALNIVQDLAQRQDLTQQIGQICPCLSGNFHKIDGQSLKVSGAEFYKMRVVAFVNFANARRCSPECPVAFKMNEFDVIFNDSSKSVAISGWINFTMTERGWQDSP